MQMNGKHFRNGPQQKNKINLFAINGKLGWDKPTTQKVLVNTSAILQNLSLYRRCSLQQDKNIWTMTSFAARRPDVLVFKQIH
jgi:hypothetical protein